MSDKETSIEEIQRELKELKEKVFLLEEENKQKNKFFSIIAHDLGSPFQSALSSAELFVSEYYSMDDKERLELAIINWNSLKNIFEVLKNLLIWSRSQMGSIPFNPIEHDTKSFISYVMGVNIKVLMPGAQKKKIKVGIFIPENLKVLIDRDMTATVMRNLVRNAIKFTHNNGEIKISAKKIENFVKIEVKDNGVGISEKNLDKIFKMDEKYQILGTEGENGTGLGLMLCKDFVEKQGGKIWVESELGKGSNFIFTIPFVKE